MPVRFSIDSPALTRGPINRSEDLRDPDRLVAAWRGAKVLLVGGGNTLPITVTDEGVRLILIDAAVVGAAPPVGAVFLGRAGHTDYWAMPDPSAADPDPAQVAASATAAPPGTGATYSTIRAVGPLLGDDEAALATTAVALLSWHAAAGFCARCGRAMTPDPSGHSRICPLGHQEFPRTDPAVIVLVHDGADRVILARQPSWEAGRFSVLAGFAEAGESLESTVVREISEEVGVAVDDVNYLGSQPWPFPRSLMIAFSAQAPRGAELRPRSGEIEDARWFSRAELAALLAGDDEAGVSLPGPVSIARRMVEGFVAVG